MCSTKRPRPSVVLGFVLASLAAPTANAQLHSVFVSQRQGADKAACGEIDRPCATFAFSETRAAASGRIIVLDSGEYGPVTITKSLTIEAPEGVSALVTISSAPFEVAAGAADVVTLRGLTISSTNGTGSWGLSLVSGRRLHVEKCTFVGVMFGIYARPVADLHDVFVTQCVFRDNGDGINLARAGTSSLRATVDRCTFEGNGVGIGVHDGAVAVIRSCTIAGGWNGLEVGSSFPTNRTELDIDSCLITGNDIGVSFNNGNSLGRMSNTTVVGNRVALDGYLLTRGNNTVEGYVYNLGFSGTFQAK